MSVDRVDRTTFFNEIDRVFNVSVSLALLVCCVISPFTCAHRVLDGS